MMSLQDNIGFIKLWEGFKAHQYVCPAGKQTIYYGHNLDDDPDPQQTGRIILINDLARCENNLKRALTSISTNYTLLPDTIKFVLIDMCYNMGLTRLLEFKKMFQCIRLEDWQGMIEEMIDSDYYKDVKNRADELVKTIKEFIKE